MEEEKPNKFEQKMNEFKKWRDGLAKYFPEWMKHTAVHREDNRTPEEKANPYRTESFEERIAK